MNRFMALRRTVVLLCAGLCASLMFAAPATCSRITIQGEVSYGQAWSAAIGQGWVLRLVPVRPAEKYSGWDIVLDRVEPAGFPDAVFLATPPYGSLNEREIATTFGLRAQDAIGWNPRSFRFLTDPATFRAGQKMYLTGFSSQRAADPKAAGRLLDLIQSASQGELRILDSRLAAGIGDPAPYAQNWALAALRGSYQSVPPPSGRPTERGSLVWMRFSVALWLPAGWRNPAGWTEVPAACPGASPQR